MQNWLFDNQYIFIVLLLWSLPWKGVALWKAARNHSIWWFCILLIVNSFGILDALYIFVISEEKYRTFFSQIPQNLSAILKKKKRKPHAKKYAKKKTAKK